MKKKGYFFAIGGMFIILLIMYYNIRPTVNEEDITIEAKLSHNSTEKNEHYKYIMDIKVTKSKEGRLDINPYFDGILSFSVDQSDTDKFYVPENLGSGGQQYVLARQTLLDNHFQINDSISIVKYIIPNEAGEYTTRLYLNSSKSLEEITNPLIVCVYAETKFIKSLSWAKTAPITVVSN